MAKEQFVKIVHFIWSLSTGGAENLVVDLANSQSREHDVILIVGNDLIHYAVKQRLNNQVKFIGIERPENSRNPYWIIKLLMHILAIRPDVIHTHHSNLISLRHLIPFPMVLTVHTTNVHLKDNVKKFAAICCISKAVFQDLSVRYPLLELVQVDNGIEVAAIKGKLDNARGDLRIVQVGRLDHSTKGQDLLVEAIALIKRDIGQQKIQVDFIGDGPSRAHLEALAINKGVVNECRFLGPKPRGEIYETLHTYDLLVQPSRLEGFGLTVAEGMAAKIPVLVSDVEGPMEVIAQGLHGYSFRSGDVESLVLALKQVLNDVGTPKMVDATSRAWAYVRDQYDVNVTADRYVKVYETVSGL
jgi:glycosyltransferase involved in cell wall biosynthesis